MMSESPPHETRISSRRAFDGRLLHLRVDDVRLPSGRSSVREVIEHPGSVAILPITADGDILLIRQYRYAVGREMLEIPAGLLEPGETPEEAARRELREETGHDAGELRRITSCFPAAGFSNERQTRFLATNCTPVTHEADPDEGISQVRMPLSELDERLASDDELFQDGKTGFALLWYAWTIRRAE
jgi:ADP-ribose pyrophosphatase